MIRELNSPPIEGYVPTYMYVCTYCGANLADLAVLERSEKSILRGDANRNFRLEIFVRVFFPWKNKIFRMEKIGEQNFLQQQQWRTKFSGYFETGGGPGRAGPSTEPKNEYQSRVPGATPATPGLLPLPLAVLFAKVRVKIRCVAHDVLVGTAGRFLLRTAAGRGGRIRSENTTINHIFISTHNYLGRVSLRCWRVGLTWLSFSTSRRRLFLSFCQRHHMV